jgi:peptidyl-prolyl cis-trans isomerase SurA
MQKQISGIKNRAGGSIKALLLGGCLAFSPLVGSGVLAQTAASGSPFAPVMKINDSVITQYELDQRKLFLMLLRQPGDPEKEAMRGLIQDRLAAGEARRFDVRLTREQVTEGMNEFAGRANLTAEQLIEALGQAGVSAETFRDFVANGLLWRDIIRGRFGGSVVVTEAEVDRAIANGTNRTEMQLLLSELAIPVEGDPEDELALARRLRAEINSEAAFASAARRYSASPSAGRGGRLDWTPAGNLPPQVVQLALATGPGQVSEPVTLPEAIILFQLRDVAEDQSAEGPLVEVEYAEYLIPNTEDVLAQAAALSNRIDTCKDLYAEARVLPEDRLTVTRKTVPELPSDIGLELAKLDPGESSTGLTRGGFRVFLMLCAREPKGEAPIDRDAIRNQLVSQELVTRAELYLEELRSEAIIETP